MFCWGETSNFYDIFTALKTVKPSCHENPIILGSALSTQYRLVTERRMDGRTPHNSKEHHTGKNWLIRIWYSFAMHETWHVRHKTRAGLPLWSFHDRRLPWKYRTNRFRHSGRESQQPQILTPQTLQRSLPVVGLAMLEYGHLFSLKFGWNRQSSVKNSMQIHYSRSLSFIIVCLQTAQIPANDF